MHDKLYYCVLSTMKKIKKILSLLIISVLVLASCIKNEEIETNPECAITSFSIGDITTRVTIKNNNGNDTIIKKIISGKDIYFNIDQLNGTITTIDSIANWVDLSKVCTSFTAYGNVFARVNGDSLYYKLTSGADSINFEKPLDVMVLSTDGRSTKYYNVSIKKSKFELDTLIWKSQTNDFAVKDDFKVLALNNRVYAFAGGNDGTMITSASTGNNLTTWTTPVKVKNADIDYSSVTLFKDEFYALGTDGYIYKAQDAANPEVWNKVSEKTFKNLLASDKYYIYAADENEISSSADLQTWKSCGSQDIDMLPTSCVNSYSYNSKTNSNIIINTMCGMSENKNSVAWYKITSLDNYVNQDWMYIQITKDNGYALPKFKDMSVALLKGSLYAIGIEEEKSVDKYNCLYRSDDNGISWHKQEHKYFLPTDLDATKGAAKMICVDDNLWIIQKGGNVWSGVIR